MHNALIYHSELLFTSYDIWCILAYFIRIHYWDCGSYGCYGIAAVRKIAQCPACPASSWVPFNWRQLVDRAILLMLAWDDRRLCEQLQSGLRHRSIQWRRRLRSVAIDVYHPDWLQTSVFFHFPTLNFIVGVSPRQTTGHGILYRQARFKRRKQYCNTYISFFVIVPFAETSHVYQCVTQEPFSLRFLRKNRRSGPFSYSWSST
jgi:hypothetical protein